jgi:hypothetical protein
MKHRCGSAATASTSGTVGLPLGKQSEFAPLRIVVDIDEGVSVAGMIPFAILPVWAQPHCAVARRIREVGRLQRVGGKKSHQGNSLEHF